MTINMDKTFFKILAKYRNNIQKFNSPYEHMQKEGEKMTNVSSLLYVGNDKTTKAYYDKNLCIMLIVNNDLYIDHIFYLYDRKLKMINTDQIEVKLQNILENYYKSTKNELINSLYKNGFISYTVFQELLKANEDE